MATEASSALQSHAATLPLTHQIVAPVAVGARPVVLATWAVFLALLLSLAWRQRLRLRENLPFLAQALGVVTLGALTILGFAPRAPLHEYAEFNHATEPFFAEWPTAYGETLNALALAVDQVLRQGVPSLFLVNGVLATGAIAAIIALIGFALLNGKTQGLVDDINGATVEVMNLVVNNRSKVNVSGLQQG